MTLDIIAEVSSASDDAIDSIYDFIFPGEGNEEVDTTTLLSLVANGNVSGARTLLLSGKGVNINYMNIEGEPPIIVAIANADYRMFNLLLEHGACINIKSANAYGFTPLHTAVYYEREGMISVLIAAGADVEERNTDGQTPLGQTTTKTTYIAQHILSCILKREGKDKCGYGSKR